MCSRFCILLTICLCLAAILPANAELPDRAPDITRMARIILSRRSARLGVLTDGDYSTQWGEKEGYIEFRLPADCPCYTLYALTCNNPDYVIVKEKKDGRWQKVQVEGDRFNTHCIPLDGLTHFRLTVTKGILRVMEVRLFGAGELPPEVVNYHAVADKADLMVLACHPDDDILWMGGLMPTYAGQLGMKVQLVYMTSKYYYRRCEAMDALWHCGVRQGPVFMGLPDIGKNVSYGRALNAWEGERETAVKIARMIRRFRPEVLVTQDTNGEYGHVQHQIMVAACTEAVRIAADPDVRKLRGLPAWEVRKYYIHLYPEGPVVLDFERPLPAFGGKTAFGLATEAFALHRSQQSGRHAVAVDGPYDIRRYGLVHSAVGPDTRPDMLFEHIEGLEDIERAFWDGNGA